MAIIAGNCVVAVENLSKSPDEFRQLGGIDRGVFDKGDRLLISLDAQQETETRLPHSPNGAHLLRLQSLGSGVSYTPGLS